jgi:glycosyltransferase involved in cell wall biosynthesis
MTKTIWIDGYEANVPQRLGSGQVAFQLLKNLEQIDYINDYLILLPSEPLPDLPKPRDKWQYKVLKPNKLWTRIALPLFLFKSKQKPDLFFSPTHYSPWLSPVKRIVTIFDLSYLHFPEMFKPKDLYQLTNWSKQSIQKASQIITISQSSKKDIVKTYHIDPKKVSVCYPGYNEELFHPVSDQSVIKKILDKYHIVGEYVLFIGTVQPRKNLKRLIQSFEKIDHLKLVVVGKIHGEGRQAWQYEEILDLPKKLNIEDRVIFTDFVPDEDMLYLLNGAKAFVLPSLWEGFGIPVVDAMACGVPVIVSNVSSLPEVAGDAGLYVDPTSIDQIEQAIRLISTDKKLYTKLSKQAVIQARKFSWKKMARQVRDLFEKNRI